MDKKMQLIGKAIIEKKRNIAETLHKDRMAEFTLTPEESQKFSLIEEKIIEMRTEIIGMFGEILIHYKAQEKIFDRIKQWGEESGKYLFHLGVPLDIALKDTSYYREYIWKAIQEETETLNITTEELFTIIYIIDPLLDKGVYYFSLTYIEAYQQTIENNKKELLNLSVPVVPLTKGVAILPIIGNFDAERAKPMIKETLNAANELHLEKLIIDLSGITSIDTMEAVELFELINALKLIGVCTIVTGIKPKIAQLIVKKGIDFENIKTKANLQQAIHDLFILVTPKF